MQVCLQPTRHKLAGGFCESTLVSSSRSDFGVRTGALADRVRSSRRACAERMRIRTYRLRTRYSSPQRAKGAGLQGCAAAIEFRRRRRSMGRCGESEGAPSLRDSKPHQSCASYRMEASPIGGTRAEQRVHVSDGSEHVRAIERLIHTVLGAQIEGGRAMRSERNAAMSRRRRRRSPRCDGVSTHFTNGTLAGSTSWRLGSRKPSTLRRSSPPRSRMFSGRRRH